MGDWVEEVEDRRQKGEDSILFLLQRLDYGIWNLELGVAWMTMDYRPSPDLPQSPPLGDRGLTTTTLTTQ